jgi:hypothetical protein
MAADEFQDRMMKYIKYGLTIKTTIADGKEYNLVGINYKPSWDVVEPSKDSGVFCMPDKNGGGMCYYFSETKNGVGCIFDSIEETIHYNEDVEKKVNLLRAKIGELQELFANESYEDLTMLRFVIDKEKPKKQKTKKQQPDKKVEEHNTEPESVKREEPIASNDVEVVVNMEDTHVVTGNNKEEANEIDAKIARALGKI